MLIVPGALGVFKLLFFPGVMKVLNSESQTLFGYSQSRDNQALGVARGDARSSRGDFDQLLPLGRGSRANFDGAVGVHVGAVKRNRRWSLGDRCLRDRDPGSKHI